MPPPSETDIPEDSLVCQLPHAMTLEDLHQWREMLMRNSKVAVNPVLTAPEQQKTPLLASPFAPPVLDRDILPSVATLSDPRRLCVPSQFGSSLLPNTIMPNMMPSPAYPGWGLLPPESIKVIARRNEIFQRQQHSARMEMERHAIYQQRRTERMNSKGLTGLGIPFIYGSSIPASFATYQGRSMLPACDLHFHSSTLRNVQGNSMLVTSSPHFQESWGQKCHRLRRGSSNQKALDSKTECSKSQAEAQIPVKTHANPYEEDGCITEPAAKTLNRQKPKEANKQWITPLANTSEEIESTHRKFWRVPGAHLEAPVWDTGKEKASGQVLGTCNEKNGGFPPVSPSLPGAHKVTSGGNLSLDKDIQKWTVTDVYNFISNLPGCSEYAQVFQDHGIDGEALPLLTEGHLRSMLGLKLGPALKIQAQVSQHMDSKGYKLSLPPPASAQPAALCPSLVLSSWGSTWDVPTA